MKKTVLFLMLLYVSSGFAQHDVSIIDEGTASFISKLETRGISSYFTADRYCDPSLKNGDEPEQTCTDNERYIARYFFWEEQGKTMIKQLDNCGFYATIALQDNTLSKFYRANRGDMKTNKVEPYIRDYKGKERILRLYKGNCYRYFMLKGSDGAFIRKYNTFDLTTNTRKSNLNFEVNNKLAIVALDKMIDQAIVRMESNFYWKRM